MVLYPEINGNDTIEVVRQVNEVTNYFNWVLIALYLVFGIYLYSSKERKGGSSAFFGSFTISGLLTVTVAGLLLSLDFVTLEVVIMFLGLTILSMIIHLFTE